MPVVTISGGSYSRGKEVAQTLAEELNYKCISRDILVETSDQFNIPEIKLIKALHDAPSVLERFNHAKDQYISFFKSCFLCRMTKGNIVYHGLAGHFFLQDISHVLKVRINAGMSDRVAEEMKRENCSRDHALSNLRKDDEERRKWGLQLYRKDTWDSRLYDIVLCVDSLGIENIVEILANTIRKKQFRETEESLAKIQRAALQAKIQARLNTFSPNTEVTLLNNSSIRLDHVDGALKSDTFARCGLADKLKEEFQLEAVSFRESVQPYREHVNSFYNIDAA